MSREDRDVALTASERRQLDPTDRKPVEEIVAERPFLDGTIEIAPRRGDDANVDADPLVAPDPSHLRALERSKELRLEWQLEVTDLVDEERPAVGLFEDALPGRGRSGEGAFFVAEQLRLDERRRHRRAVEDDEGALDPRALLVEGLGEDLLAGAGLALDDDGNVGHGQPIAKRIEGTHRGARAPKASKAGPRLGWSRRLEGGEHLFGCAHVALDAERRASESDDLSPVEPHLADVEARCFDLRAVRGAEIRQNQVGAVEIERDMPPRDRSVSELHGAYRALAHEKARSLGRIENEALSLVRPLDDDERVAKLGRPIGPRQLRRRKVLEIRRHLGLLRVARSSRWSYVSASETRGRCWT
jgi:hypothetical protein